MTLPKFGPRFITMGRLNVLVDVNQPVTCGMISDGIDLLEERLAEGDLIPDILLGIADVQSDIETPEGVKLELLEIFTEYLILFRDGEVFAEPFPVGYVPARLDVSVKHGDPN